MNMQKDRESIASLAQGGGRFIDKSMRVEPDKLKISVITVTFNASEFLRDTINSIRAQNYSNIEWIVIDGGSTDGTVDLLRANEDIIYYWVSESDRGMYDAIAKGFENSHGEILCWLNAGDIFLAGALELVHELFERNKKVNWLMGMQLFHLPGAKIINSFLPVMFSSDLIRCGAYGQRLPFIQQESTFFRRCMLSIIDVEKFRNFKLAGDLYLWYCFAKQSQPTVVSAGLGSFCFHNGQLSEDQVSYWREAREFLEPYSMRAWIKIFLQLPLQYLPLRFKKMIAGKNLILWRKGRGWD